MQTLGFIGVGNMGEALVRGLVQAGTARSQDVLVSARRKERVEELSRLYGVRGGSNSEVARQSDVVVLAVKPQILDQVLREIAGDIDRNKLIISVAAGVPIAAIERLPPPPLPAVGTFPTAPAPVRAGAPALALGSEAPPADL